MNPQLQTPVPHEQTGTRENRRSEIARLLRKGKTFAEIAAEVRCGQDLIAAVVKAIRIPPETRRVAAQRAKAAEVKALLLAGKTYDEIIEETSATKYLVWNVGREIDDKPKLDTTGLFPSPRKNPTHCIGRRDCECVWHRAEAERERRLEAKRKGVNQGGRR
jgi:uncharacterized protein YerC